MRRAVLLVWVVAGCDADVRAACEAEAARTPLLEIGQGLDAFTPWTEDTVLPVDRGPQGGWHTYGTLRAVGVWGGRAATFDETTPVVDFEVVSDAFSGGFTGLARRFVRTNVGADPAIALLGELLVLDVADGSEADGAVVTVRARIVDACGTEVEDAREGVLRL